MEKITLKPIVRELLYKADEPNTHFDVLSYTGANSQERSLGSLYLLGHVTYEEEDLGYVVSLISSLAKREYYSEQSIHGQDPKLAFERSLKKLNEVLDDFFKNKSLKLNIGLAAISGDQIFLSKVGKFKVGLARNNEFIDVLNNLVLFQKSEEDERQFSNIISGKLQAGDKLFAYYPARAITSREKGLREILVQENQQQFSDKIALLASTAPNFTCCGVHISIEQIKEIPLQTPTATFAAMPRPAVLAPNTTAVDSVPLASPPEPEPKAKVIASELSVSQKSNLLTSVSSAAAKLRNMNRLPVHKKFRWFIVIALVIIVPLSVVAFLRARGDSSEITSAYTQAEQNLKLAKAKMAQNDTVSARNLLMASLAQIAPYQNQKIITVRNDLEASLDTIDRASQTVPVLFGTLASPQAQLLEKAMILGISNEGKPTAWFNRAEFFSVLDLKTDKTSEFTLQDPASAVDALVYDVNLYVLSANHIYKYADAMRGGKKRAEWGSEQTDELLSIAADGNIYGLTGSGAIITYFKGVRKGVVKTDLPIDAKSRIFTASETQPFLLLNPALKRLYVVEKADGKLMLTYKLDAITGNIRDIAISPDGVIWAVSVDNRLWQIKQ